MKLQLRLGLALALTLSFFSSKVCMSLPQSDLNEQATRASARAEAKLDVVYKEVIAKHASNQLFLSKLKTSQSAWLGYRDAQLKAIFPADKPQEEYGSDYSTCYQAELLTQIERRSEQLAAMSSIGKSNLTDAKTKSEHEEFILDTVYRQASSKISPKYLRYLQESQSEWLAFRDAECDALVTLSNSSNREIVRWSSRASMNTTRISELNEWAVAFKGPSKCCGSRFKD